MQCAADSQRSHESPQCQSVQLMMQVDSTTTITAAPLLKRALLFVCLVCLPLLSGPNLSLQPIIHLRSTVQKRAPGNILNFANPPVPSHTECPSAPLDLYVVGGYRGEKLAEDLSRGLLAALHASPQVFRVVLACIAGLNSRPTADGSKAEVSGVAPPSGGPCVAASARVGNSESAAATEPTNNHEEDPSETSSIKSSYDGEDKQAGKALHCKKWLPRRTSLAIDLATGRAFPVRFEGIGRGPGWEVRHSRIFAGARETVLANVSDIVSAGIESVSKERPVHGTSRPATKRSL